ncbi:MAG TPA: hypothetical protein RMH85_14700 [Polyangiaceae bacterium LLY-WYZ-15_(1-7)]|nr:hypothetical protein [Sandaracinus sp.]HJL02749.1 hypothetical protein [Polyangiaceae bacterium LLY-WYZ-15_(1-7)]MBJ73792.1 hypothetical protein [Sandaracinus sp.]HJL09749.1 hypothetical protein [Polyangiaceae bacterium LLY-WYZ-15_(1-7)]HJL31790.1 hypothetical protein [Polyangiaceae bacterium LLY-WYZ-15_(1-7)]
MRSLRLRVPAALFLAATLLACPGDDPEPEWEEAFDASEVGWLLSVWGPSPEVSYTVGGTPQPSNGVVWRRDADGWAELDLGVDVPLLNWVTGFGPDDVWMVGNDGVIVHGDGSSWETVDSPTDQDLWGVWGAAPDDIYAVGGVPFAGGEPTVIHWDGASWEAVETPELSRANVFAFFKVWGSGPDDVWVVGQQGAVIHWDGSAWSEVLVGADVDLISIWGTGPDRIAVVGGRGNGWVFTWDGSEWRRVQPAGLPGLNGVWMGSDDVIHVCGEQGEIATFDFDTREMLTEPYQETSMAFHAIHGDGARLTTVGGSFNDPAGPDFRGLAYSRALSDAD